MHEVSTQMRTLDLLGKNTDFPAPSSSRAWFEVHILHKELQNSSKVNLNFCWGKFTLTRAGHMTATLPNELSS